MSPEGQSVCAPQWSRYTQSCLAQWLHGTIQANLQDDIILVQMLSMTLLHIHSLQLNFLQHHCLSSVCAGPPRAVFSRGSLADWGCV